ncbi:hypothetical protein PV387_03405 [Streptomyces sp. ME02-6987-2C]|uniref:hypothetical protein n=1 Tax=unclassified Streptomyces TaxID=2593676 RepID=UPI0029AC227A|nr:MULTISPECIES: hypothetical protein [unclassified Streptomyces]MDX3345886.1 hypothetical protein [Streptomyces sp. ME02-6979A]MDX3365081.1 hypothetical protein [Streptomyces sp. ME02-6987-2C]MDX3404864.1 hypothetical protein [Streptomyces sp. ME02-6977A]MDX3421652.1 hypothetical protein [Streptomyces sp. ME02-6985-2c]
MPVSPAPCPPGGGSTPIEVTTCCAPSIASTPLCRADGTLILAVVRSGCVECGETPEAPAAVGWIDPATGLFTAGVLPADAGSCAAAETAACCSPSITSATLCQPDGTSILVVVRSACLGCAEDPTDPVVVGWFDLTTGVFTAGPAPAGAGPCEAGCVDTVCRQLCDDTDGDGAADATYSELWCIRADGSAELVLTYQDDPSVPYTPIAPVDCTYGCPESETVTLCDDEGPFLRRYTWLDGTATYVDVALDGTTPHVVTGTVGTCTGSSGDAAGCCAPSIASTPLCRADGSTVLLVVRSGCAECGDAPDDPQVVGWLDTAGVFTAGPAPVDAGPCSSGCVDTVCRTRCDDTDGDGAADATYSELWCIRADGSAELVLTYQDDPATPYTPVTPLDCEYASEATQTLTLCDDGGPFLRRYSWLGGSASYEDVALDGSTPHSVTGTVALCPAVPDCEAPTTPAATLGLCLADGTPIAVVVTRDCDGVVTQDGWINLVTGTYSVGDPPAGTMACGNPRSISTTGTFCDVDPASGDVLGLVLIEYTYGADGAVAAVRLVDATTGQTYTPQGEVTTCPAGVEQPERDLVQLCDTAADGTATAFVRDYARDENGQITGHTDYLLDGAPYTPAGTVGLCPAESACRDCTSYVLCDTDATSPATITGTAAAGTLPNGVSWRATGPSAFPPNTQGDGAAWWGNGLFPNPVVPLTTYTFDQPVTVDFSVVILFVPGTDPGQNTAQLPVGAVPLSLPSGYTYDRTTGILTADATLTDCALLNSPTRDGSARFRVAGVSSFALRYLGPRSLLADCRRLGNWLFGALDVSLGDTFLRTVCRDCDGMVTSITDTLLDGTTPYTPVGLVGVCSPTGEGTSGEPCRDVASTLLCDVASLDTVTVFDPATVQDADGWEITSFTDGGCTGGNPPDGPVPGPAVWSGGFLSIRADRTLGANSCSGWTGYDTAPVRWVLTKTFTAAEDGMAVISADTFRGDGGARVRVNGQDVGLYGQWNQPAVGGSTQVPVTAGPNVVEIEVRDVGGPNWVTGRLNVVMTRTVQFMRRTVTDCETGEVVSVTDTTLDGAPYEVTGTVGQCEPVAECCEQPPPETRVDVETALLCVRDQASGETIGQVLAERVYDDQSGDLTEQRLTDLDGAPYTLPAGAELGTCKEPDCPVAFSTECVGAVTRTEASYDNTSLIGGVPGQCGSVQGPNGQFPCQPTSGAYTITSWIVNGMEVIAEGSGRTFNGGACGPGTAGAPGMHLNWSQALTNLDPTGATWSVKSEPACAFFVGSTGGTQTVYGPMTVQDAAGQQWILGPAQACVETQVTKVYTQQCDGSVTVSWLDPQGVETEAPEGDLVPCGTGCGAGGGQGLDVEKLTLCDVQADGTAVPFLRHLTYGSAGQVAVVIDTALDGFAPYTPTGTVGRCPTEGRDVELLPMCVVDNASDNVIQRILAEVTYDTATGERLGVTYVDPRTWGPVAVPGGTHFDLCPEEQPTEEPCRDSSTLLVCDLPDGGTPTPVVSDTDPDAYFPGPPTVPVPGGTPALWSGGSITIGPDTAPGPHPSGVVRTIAATVEAARPLCDIGTAHVRASVDVAQLGPSDGCGPVGWLFLFNGTTQVIHDAPPNNAPAGWTGTLTVEADVPAADLAAGQIAVVLGFDTYDSCDGVTARQTSWQLSGFTATTTYDQTGCATQVFATVVTDCETGTTQSVTYALPDGTPYTPVGTIGPCEAGGGACCAEQPCGDTEIAQLCDLTYDPQAPIPTPAGDFALTGNVVAANDGTTLWFAQANQEANGVAELVVGGLLPAVMYEFRFASAWIGAGAPTPATNNAIYLLEILDGTTVLASRTRNVSNGSNMFPGGVLTEDLPPVAFIAPATGAVTIRFTDQTTGGPVNDRDLFLMPLEVRTAALTVTSTPFLRRFTFGCDGALTSTEDVGLDGVTPYEVQGEAGHCTSDGGTADSATPCNVQNVIQQCRCDDTDGDGVPDVGYIELLAVDCTGQVTSVGTYTEGMTGPYTPVSPVDCDTVDPAEGADPAFGVQARRIDLTAGAFWDAAAWPTLQSVTAVAHSGTGSITTADGASTLHAGESATWSVGRDTDAALTGPLTITAGTGTVTLTYTIGVTL